LHRAANSGRGGWRASLAWGGGGLVAVIILAQVMGVLSQPRGAGPDQGLSTGLRILRHYDIVGAVAHDPTLKLEIIAKASPKTAPSSWRRRPRSIRPSGWISSTAARRSARRSG